MFSRLTSWLSGGPRLRLAVVTPVGPGHADLYTQCRASVEAAWQHGRGPFTALECIAVDDGEGRLGRSRARNEGIARAAAAGADWLFFLDADDLMVEGAFATVAPYLAGADAVWGLILGLAPAAERPHLRVPQIVAMDSLDDLLLFDPFLTLQMGHFVRTPVAQAIGFDEALDAGEDFDYYLRLWARYRGLKVPREFFINRHARHSGGPRAASAEDWGRTVRERQRDERVRRNLPPDAPAARARRTARIGELQAFCRGQGLVAAGDAPSLAAQMPYAGTLEVNEYEGGTLRLQCADDDPACAQLAWTGEYRPFAAALWQALAARGSSVVDIGARNGLFALLAARAGAARVVVGGEPAALARVREDCALNEVAVECVVAGAGGEPAGRAVDAYLRQAAGAAPGAIHVSGMDAAGILHGLLPALAQERPELLIDAADGSDLSAVMQALQGTAYRLWRIDEAGHALVPCAEAGVAREAVAVLASVRAPKEVGVIVTAAHGSVREA